MILGIWITQGITQGGGGGGGGGFDRNEHRNLDHRGYISEMREIITLLREIAEFSIKLREAPVEIGRVDTYGLPTPPWDIWSQVQF